MKYILFELVKFHFNHNKLFLVCELVDVSFESDAFDLLENCTVINGYLHIKFINDYEEEERVDFTEAR